VLAVLLSREVLKYHTLTTKRADEGESNTQM
jgi:hypothetical protein